MKTASTALNCAKIASIYKQNEAIMEQNMAMPSKKINTELPMVSYEIVKRAAELKGSTIRSFAASAIVSEAIRTTREIESAGRGSVIERLDISPESVRAIFDMMLHQPDISRKGFEKALKMAASHREIPVPDEDRL